MKLVWNRSLLLLAALGIVLYAAVVAVSNWLNPDGSSSAEPVVSKTEAAAAALSFAKDRFGLTDAATFVTYQTHKLRSSYLERNHLTEPYRKKYGDSYPIDFFTVELKSKPASGAEARVEHWFVDIDFTTKRVLGWSEAQDSGHHTGKAPHDRVKSEAVARAALQRQGFDTGDFTLLAESAQRQRDTLFVFESKSQRIGEAKLQVQIDADETRAFSFAPAFMIPQEHVGWMARQDSIASIITWASVGFMFLMAVAGFIYAVLYRKRISFARGAALTIIYVLFYCVNNLNMLPALKGEQGSAVTTQSTLLALIFTNFVTLLMAVGVYVSCVSGAELWRRTGWSPWPRWREQRFGADVWASMGRGYLLCLFTLGLQQVLFLGAEQGFGVWAVNDASNSPYNLLVPALFPLLAWCAAISEESTFRLFGIAFFSRIVRSRFAAVLLSSVIWAAGHTQYPIYPVYTRLVEVTALGLIFGYAFLKYGFLTVLFAHASMDSLLMGMDLFSLHHVSDAVLGAVYMASPLLVGLALAWLHRRSLGKRYKIQQPPPA